MPDSTTTQTDDPDIVWGAAAIGRVIQATPRKTFYLLERGLLPAKKIGAQWVSSRRKLRARLLGEDGEARRGGAA